MLFFDSVAIRTDMSSSATEN